MQTHPAYSNVAEEERQRLLSEAHMGRLITLPAGGGWPRIGLFPYVCEAGRFEIHLPRPDPQLADLAAVAAQIRGLLERHEPAGTHESPAGDSARYLGSLRRLVLVRLHVECQHAAFKCAQQVSAVERARIVAGLEARGADVDRRSAALVRRLAPKSP